MLLLLVAWHTQIVALTEALEGQNVAALDLSFNEFSNTGTRALAQLIQVHSLLWPHQ